MPTGNLGDQNLSKQSLGEQHPGEQSWTDQKIEVIVGNLLRAGVLLSASVVLIGAILYLVRHGGSPVEFRVFQGEPADLRSLHGVVRDTIALRARGIIQLGLLILIATPIARVAFSIYAFAMERDRMYVIFTVIVFLILMFSILGTH
jgi:uncharacterized membrane protein